MIGVEARNYFLPFSTLLFPFALHVPLVSVGYVIAQIEQVPECCSCASASEETNERVVYEANPFVSMRLCLHENNLVR